MLSVSITILTVLLVVVSLLMILLVLMQRPKQEGLGAAFGGGMMNEALGAHTTDILQKGTVWLSVMFFSLSIVLGILYTKQIASKNNVNVLDGVKQEQLPPMPPPSIGELPQPTPLIPGTPESGDSTPAPATKEGADTAGEKENGPTEPVSDGGAAEEKTNPGTESSGAASGESKPSESGEPAPADAPSGDTPNPTDPGPDNAGGKGKPE